MNTESNIFPVQKISLQDKTEKWQRSCVDSIIAKNSDGVYLDGQSRKDRMKIAYDLYNSNFDEKDFKHVTDPFNVGDAFPSKMQNHK
jgi:transcriptional antiterminator